MQRAAWPHMRQVAPHGRSDGGADIGALHRMGQCRREVARDRAAVEAFSSKAQARDNARRGIRVDGIDPLNFAARARPGFRQTREDRRLQDVAPDNGQARWCLCGFGFFHQTTRECDRPFAAVDVHDSVGRIPSARTASGATSIAATICARQPLGAMITSSGSSRAKG